MASNSSKVATQHRTDYSRCIVHLTRDDRKSFTNGATGRDNLLQILRSKEIWAVKPHCIYNDKISKLPKEQQEGYRVACFTEVPLSQLHLLVQEIPGRQIKLEAYGVVFTKDFIAKKGGQPAIYINSYDGNLHIRESVDYLFSVATQSDDHKVLRRIVPFMNAMHEQYDFTWEREWRTPKSLKFKLSDLVCIILPENGEDDIKEKALSAGIAVISPGWTYEQIITELAEQQRKTKDTFGSTKSNNNKEEK
ncbi:hypothetical protein [Undibacterium sp. WLHG33]|uniref:hypothetical protein n=1 Tax=Undibacterium sp. WLHG33 TaxID=3412482 RepID=UPI003C2ADF53